MILPTKRDPVFPIPVIWIYGKTPMALFQMVMHFVKIRMQARAEITISYRIFL